MKEPGKKYNDEDNMLVNDLRSIVSKARSKAFAAVNYSLVERNWRIGKRIVEQEQNGASRAEYGKHVIEIASAALTEEFGKGFSYTNIANYKRFYLTFNNLQILQTLSEEFNNPIQQTLPAKSSAPHKEDKAESTQSELRLLPWSHYERLIRVEDKKAREWYAKEAFEQGWSFRTLNRNINTLYYERLLMSKKKQPVVNEMQDKGLSARQTRIHQITSCLGIPWITGRHLPCRIKIRDCHHQQPREILDGNGKRVCARGSPATYPNRGE